MIADRAMIGAEMQLEADRNEAFRPYFKRYLDNTYREMRALFITIFRRYGKVPPATLDVIVVLAYQFGLHLGSQTILGDEIGARVTPSELMLTFFRNFIETSPALDKAFATAPQGLEGE